MHVGWRTLHSDVSLNFQLNRWLAYGGEQWLDDVTPILPSLTNYDAWRDGFLALADRAEADGRTLHAALHLRAAEFFMVSTDARKAGTRARLLALFRQACRIPECDRVSASCGTARLPVVRLRARDARDVIVIFGGFDSYIEEFLPILVALRDSGHDVVAFEGPGQGAVLEEQHVAMTPAWHEPVGAVLDALELDEVTLIGISLGGCLAIRAAAREPRVRRVVAFDALSDFRACMLAQVPALARPVVRGLLGMHAKPLLDGVVSVAARHRPVIEWGIAQAMHVFGASTPYDAWRAAERFRTDDVSPMVKQDVLLLAGADDHYVPLSQLWDQARTLVAARSVTCRVFSREEQAQAHCQVGNLPLAIDVIDRWIDGVKGSPLQ